MDVAVDNTESHRDGNVDEIVDYFDEYGFAVFSDSTAKSDDRCHDFRDLAISLEVEQDWRKVLKKWSRYRNGLGIKLLNLVKKGVPSNIRPKLWKRLLDIDLLKSSTDFIYQEEVAKLREYLTALNVTEYNINRAEQELAFVEFELKNVQIQIEEEPSIPNLRQIFLDVARTFPTHLQFFGHSPEAIEGRASLFRILAIFVRFNPAIGYCQGMSFIAGMLAMVMSEEDSFWCFVALLQKPKYLLGYFDATLTRVRQHAKIFDYLLQQRHFDLWKHLHNHDVDPLMYITPWLMCLFTSLPCWDVVLTIWDLILLEGITVIFRASLAIMEAMHSSFLSEIDGNALILLLQRPLTHRVNFEVLLPIIWQTQVELWEIQSIQAVIEESEENAAVKDDAGSTNLLACQSSSTAWKTVRKKVYMQTKNETSLISKVLNMFNTKVARHEVKHSFSHPNIVITAATPIKIEDECKDKHEPLVSIENISSPTVASQLTNSELSKSTSENLHRVYRLASGKQRRSDSTESLGKGLDIFKCSAYQQHAFGMFAQQRPLRKNQCSRSNITSVLHQSPETELQPLDASSSQSSKVMKHHARIPRLNCFQSSPHACSSRSVESSPPRMPPSVKENLRRIICANMPSTEN